MFDESSHLRKTEVVSNEAETGGKPYKLGNRMRAGKYPVFSTYASREDCNDLDTSRKGRAKLSCRI